MGAEGSRFKFEIWGVGQETEEEQGLVATLEYRHHH